MTRLASTHRSACYLHYAVGKLQLAICCWRVTVACWLSGVSYKHRISRNKREKGGGVYWTEDDKNSKGVEEYEKERVEEGEGEKDQRGRRTKKGLHQQCRGD